MSVLWFATKIKWRWIFVVKKVCHHMDFFHNKSNLCTTLPYLHIRAVYNFWGHEFPSNHKPSKGENQHENHQVGPLPVHHRCHLPVHDDATIISVRRPATRIASFEERVSRQRSRRAKSVFQHKQTRSAARGFFSVYHHAGGQRQNWISRPMGKLACQRGFEATDRLYH